MGWIGACAKQDEILDNGRCFLLKIRCWIEFVLVQLFIVSLSAIFLVELGGNQCRYDNRKRSMGGHM